MQHALPQELLLALAIGPVAQVTKLAGNANDNYLIQAPAGKRNIVVKCLGEHTPANEELEGVYRRYLEDSGLPVTPFLRFDTGAYTYTVGRHSYVALDFVEGEEARGKPDEVVAQLGRLSGVFHTLEYHELPERQHWLNGSYLEHIQQQKIIDAPELEELNTQNQAFPDFWGLELPVGIGHGDLHLGNTIVNAENQVVSLIDWEETGIFPLLLDVAGTVQALSQDLKGFNTQIFDDFFRAYQAVRPLTQLELELFPEAIRYRSFIVYAWSLTKLHQGLMSQDRVDYFKQRYYGRVLVPPIPKP